MLRRGSASVVSSGLYSLNSSVSQQLLSITIQAQEGEICKPVISLMLIVIQSGERGRGRGGGERERGGGRERERERERINRKQLHIYTCTILHVYLYNFLVYFTWEGVYLYNKLSSRIRYSVGLSTCLYCN